MGWCSCPVAEIPTFEVLDTNGYPVQGTLSIEGNEFEIDGSKIGIFAHWCKCDPQETLVHCVIKQPDYSLRMMVDEAEFVHMMEQLVALMGECCTSFVPALLAIKDSPNQCHGEAIVVANEY